MWNEPRNPWTVRKDGNRLKGWAKGGIRAYVLETAAGERRPDASQVPGYRPYQGDGTKGMILRMG